MVRLNPSVHGIAMWPLRRVAVPIPNREGKPFARASVWESRTSPQLNQEPGSRDWGFLFILILVFECLSRVPPLFPAISINPLTIWHFLSIWIANLPKENPCDRNPWRRAGFGLPWHF